MKKILLVLAAVAALVSCKNAVKDADSEYAVDMIKKGESIPAFSLPDRSGVVRTQADFAGKYVVYDFWATWCPDCRADVPRMKELYAQFGRSGEYIFGCWSLQFIAELALLAACLGTAGDMRLDCNGGREGSSDGIND